MFACVATVVSSTQDSDTALFPNLINGVTITPSGCFPMNLNPFIDSCTISASYEVTQAQKALLLLPHTAKGASTSSEELNAKISPRTDDEYNLPNS